MASTVPAAPGRGRRLVAAAGLTAVALALPALVLVDPAPALGTSTAEVVAYYRDAGRPFLVYSWLLALSMPVLLAHLAAVSEWLRRHGHDGLATPYLVGGLMAHTVQLVLLAVFQLAGMAALRGDTETTRTLADLGNVGFSFCAVAELVRQVAGGLAIRRTGVVPRWLSWLPFASAGLCVLGSVGLMTRSGPLAAGSPPVMLWVMGFLVTFAAVNLALLLQRDEVAAVGPAAAGGGRHRRADDRPVPVAAPDPAPAPVPPREGARDRREEDEPYPLPQRREPTALAERRPLAQSRPLAEFEQAVRPPGPVALIEPIGPPTRSAPPGRPAPPGPPGPRAPRVPAVPPAPVDVEDRAPEQPFSYWT